MNTRSIRHRLAAIALTCFVCLAPASATERGVRGAVAGTVQFEKITNRNPWTGVAGLQVQRPILQPVAGAKIELIDQDKNVLASAVTGPDGRYLLKWFAAEAPTAHVRVYAVADNVTVVDIYDPSKIYSVSSENWQLPEGDAAKDIVATDKTRQSGPFNILAVVQLGNRFVRSAEPDVKFPPIRMRWSTRLRDGTTYFTRGTRGEIFVLGHRPVDSDEFDDFIILHEYGHYLAHNFSRDDSPGGDHSGTQRLDPRLAFSEGWASYFACAALDDPRYMDTGHDVPNSNGVRVSYDVSKPRKNGDRPGPWSEFTVSSTLWSISQNGPGNLGLGFGAVWKTFRSDAWKRRGPYRQLIDFCDVLVAARPEVGPDLAKVLDARRITYNPGQSPSVPEPFVRALPSGVKAEGELNSIGRVGGNAFDARAVYTFTLTQKTKVKLHMDIVDSKLKGKDDLDLWLFNALGRSLKQSTTPNGVGGSETIEIELDPGIYYVEVRSSIPGIVRTEKGAFRKDRNNTGSYRLVVDY